MRANRMWVMPLVLLLSTATSASTELPATAGPVTLLEVAGPKVGVYLFGEVATRYDKLVVSFTTTVPLVDVTIDVGLGQVNTTVFAFLTDRIGPGTDVGNEIASSTYSGAPGTHIPLFNNLSLGIGTYYLVLDAAGGFDEWNRLLPFDVTAQPGITRGSDYYTTEFAAYAPAASYFVNPHTADEGALQYRVIGTEASGRRSAGDFDGDGKADITVFRPSDGTWYVLQSGTSYTTATGVQWGNGLDKPVPADYEGDGKVDIAVFRASNGTWYLQYSSTGMAAAFQWGNGSDVPLPGDYNGDGRTDIAVFRPSNGTWYLWYLGTGTTAAFQWGNGLDVPVPGDYDGDGLTDVAVFRPSNGTWYLRYSGTGATAAFQWGNGSDVPVPEDYNGDGKTDIAVFRPSTGTWYLWYSGTSTTAGFPWGNGSDVPVPGDYNGDGRADIAVFRPSNGTWYLWHWGIGTAAAFQWGNSADIPILKRP